MLFSALAGFTYVRLLKRSHVHTHTYSRTFRRLARGLVIPEAGFEKLRVVDELLVSDGKTVEVVEVDLTAPWFAGAVEVCRGRTWGWGGFVCVFNKLIVEWWKWGGGF